MLSIIFFPIVAIELAVIIWLLIHILQEIEELEHHKKPPHPPNPCNPF